METQRLRVTLPYAKHALIFRITKLNYWEEISEVFAYVEMHLRHGIFFYSFKIKHHLNSGLVPITVPVKAGRKEKFSYKDEWQDSSSIHYMFPVCKNDGLNWSLLAILIINTVNNDVWQKEPIMLLSFQSQ